MQIDYLNLDNSVRNNKRECFSQSRCNHCGGSKPTKKYFMQQRKEKGYKKPPFNSCKYNNYRNEHNGWKPNKCFRCGSEDYFFENCSKLDTSDKKSSLEQGKT